MKLWVGVTDKTWFQHLARFGPDEVNFWQPSGSRSFKVLRPGEPFLFKLHSADNFIVGGGFFVRYSALPASLAWDAFGQKNGVTSFDELRARIRRYRPNDTSLDPFIGCNVLVEPFFLDYKQWIPIPKSFALNIVSGKRYDTLTEEGAVLWETTRRAMSNQSRVQEPALTSPNFEEPRFGEEYLARSRLGQGAFRVLVTDAYQRRCAVTGEKTLPVLEAAHIQPFSRQGPHRVSNGILLHRTKGSGLVSCTGPRGQVLFLARVGIRLFRWPARFALNTPVLCITSPPAVTGRRKSTWTMLTGRSFCQSSARWANAPAGDSTPTA
ncbi:MAG: HNH endonuclease [Pseudomonadota bacterium]